MRARAPTRHRSSPRVRGAVSAGSPGRRSAGTPFPAAAPPRPPWPGSDARPGSRARRSRPDRWTAGRAVSSTSALAGSPGGYRSTSRRSTTSLRDTSSEGPPHAGATSARTSAGAAAARRARIIASASRPRPPSGVEEEVVGEPPAVSLADERERLRAPHLLPPAVGSRPAGRDLGEDGRTTGRPPHIDAPRPWRSGRRSVPRCAARARSAARQQQGLPSRSGPPVAPPRAGGLGTTRGPCALACRLRSARRRPPRRAPPRSPARPSCPRRDRRTPEGRAAPRAARRGRRVATSGRAP